MRLKSQEQGLLSGFASESPRLIGKYGEDLSQLVPITKRHMVDAGSMVFFKPALRGNHQIGTAGMCFEQLPWPMLNQRRLYDCVSFFPMQIFRIQECHWQTSPEPRLFQFRPQDRHRQPRLTHRLSQRVSPLAGQSWSWENDKISSLAASVAVHCRRCPGQTYRAIVERRKLCVGSKDAPGGLQRLLFRFGKP